MFKIAIIGNKNVGKSSLFNLLSNSKEAVSINYSGYSRDCKYTFSKIMSNLYEVIDTPGLGYSNDFLDALVIKKTWDVIKQCDIILILFNVDDLLDKFFLNILCMLKRIKKKKIYVLNKVDLLTKNEIDLFFNSIKLNKFFLISVKNKLGIKELLLEIHNISKAFQLKTEKNSKAFNIAVVGRQNVGKSLLVNQIVGSDKSIVFNRPGVTRDNLYNCFFKNNKKYVIIDTPGIKKRKKIYESIEKLPTLKSFDAISKSDMCIIVFDILSAFKKQDFAIVKRVLSFCKLILIVFNKSDLIGKKELIFLEKKINKKFLFANNLKYQFISSKYLFGFSNFFNSINRVRNSCKFFVSDIELFNIKEKINNRISFINSNLLIKRINIVKFYDFKIDIHLINKNISDSYKRYLCILFIKYVKIRNVSFKFRFK